MTWQQQYTTQLLNTLTPFLTVPSTPYTCTSHDLKRLRHHAKVCDDIADALQQTSAKVKSLINISASPIFRLPSEILSEIMLWACDIPELTTFKPLKYQRFGRHMSPVLLGQVCHQWRKVSMSDSRLWTFLWIDLTFETSARDVGRVDHWFRMAKNLPVTVNITHNDDTRLVDEVHSEKLLPDWKPCRQVLKTLFDDYAHRIGSLFFGILDGGWGDLLRTPVNFTMLKHLTVNGELDPVFAPTEVQMFANTPQLESIDLWAVDPTTLRLPWNRISSLRICWAKLDDLVTVLRLCPNLGSLRVRNVEGAGDEEGDGTQGPRYDPLLLPELHTFEVIDDSHNENVLHLLQALCCPSLLKFKYNTFGSRAYSPAIIPSLLPFLHHVNNLRFLDASGILFQRDDLRNLFHTVPSLHRLVLDLSKTSEESVGPDSTATDLVQLFHRHDASGRYDILPKLRHLELEVDLKLSFDALFVAFETRCPQHALAASSLNQAVGPLISTSAGGGRGLESVWVNIHAPAGHVAPVEWKFWLDSLDQRGLPVRLNVPFAKTPIAFASALAFAPATSSRLHMPSFVDAI
ncbi:hypothetical protein D9756_001917 [Leucocoprinus leucothites]|uniref:F-box domain-containing protein n=1 Tax=Leucocoprinus leucothites TaxID=201217 RepID=A0A8H5G488_9AGAR|nr:hypothetical protein D9756_001917 [Leucoagaricus leucothites]